MAKRHRLVKKALEALNLEYDNSEHEEPLNDVKDVKLLIQHFNSQIDSYRENIENCEHNIEVCEGNVQKLNALLDQIEIEEYKELNPGKDVFKL